MAHTIEVLQDAPAENRNTTKSFLNKHKGKILLALGLIGGTAGLYGLGKAGMAGSLVTGANNIFMRNSPEWLTKATRQVSSVAGTRVVSAIDRLRGLPANGGFGNPAEIVRKNIAEGRHPTED